MHKAFGGRDGIVIKFLVSRHSPRVTAGLLAWRILADPRLPPLQLHVGLDEILLDDTRRYSGRAAAENIDVALHLWEGMPHVFRPMLDGS